MCIIIIIYIIIYIYIYVYSQPCVSLVYFFVCNKMAFFHGDSDGKPSQHDQIDRFSTFHQNLWMLVCTLW